MTDIRTGDIRSLDKAGLVEQVEELTAEVERLQRALDSRPAINAGLPETYIKWSQSIYIMEFARAACASS